MTAIRHLGAGAYRGVYIITYISNASRALEEGINIINHREAIRTEPVERGDTRFFTSATSGGIEN